MGSSDATRPLTARQNPAACRKPPLHHQNLFFLVNFLLEESQSKLTHRKSRTFISHRQLWEKVPGQLPSGRFAETRRHRSIFCGSLAFPSSIPVAAPRSVRTPLLGPCAYVWHSCVDEDTSLRLRGVRPSSARDPGSGGGTRFSGNVAVGASWNQGGYGYSFVAVDRYAIARLFPKNG